MACVSIGIPRVGVCSFGQSTRHEGCEERRVTDLGIGQGVHQDPYTSVLQMQESYLTCLYTSYLSKFCQGVAPTCPSIKVKGFACAFFLYNVLDCYRLQVWSVNAKPVFPLVEA